MDPITIGLGVKVLDVLLPYVEKGTEKLTKEVGVAAVDKMESLLKILKTKLSGDETAKDLLYGFEEDPETYKQILGKILQKKVERDNNLAEELDKLIHEIGPILVTDVHVNEADDDVTGIRIGHMKSGKSSARVDVDKAKKKVTGQDIDTVG